MSHLFRRLSSPSSSPSSILASLCRSFAASAVKDGKSARKQHKGVSTRGISDNPISFGRFSLQALEHGRVTAQQIEAGRRAMSRLVQRGGKIWVRVVADRPVSGKAVGIRMGKGKGAIQYWASVVKPGRLLYEMDGIPESLARTAIKAAADKMPIRTRFFTFR